MPSNEIRGGFKLTGEVNVKGVIDEKLQVRINQLTQSMLALNKAQATIARGYNINDYWNSQLSSIESVSEAYDRYVRTMNKADASDLTKAFNAFSAQGGDVEALVSRYGDGFNEIISGARKLAPAIAEAFSVDSLRQAYAAFGEMKAMGADLSEVFSALGRPDVDAMQSALNSMNRELAMATRRAEEAEERLAQLGNAEAIAQLEEQLALLQDGARRTFDTFLRANSLDGLASTGRFDDYYANIERGYLSAQQAISQFRLEYEHLLDETNSGQGAFGVQTIEQLGAEIGRIGAGIDAVLAKIQALQGATVGGTAQGDGAVVANGVAQQLSESLELTEEQRAAMANLMNQAGGLQSIADVLVTLIQSSGDAQASTTTLYDSISGIVQAMAQLSGAEAGKLESIAGALRAINGMDSLKVSGSSLTNITDALTRLSNIRADGSLYAISNISLRGFNDLHISKSSLSNLAEFLPAISGVNVETIRQLADIRWDNLNAMKVSKASVNNLANLAQIADTIEELRSRIDAAGIGKVDVTPTVDTSAIRGASEGALEAEAAAHEHAAQAATEHAAAEVEAAQAATQDAAAESAAANAASEVAAAETSAAQAAAEHTAAVAGAARAATERAAAERDDAQAITEVAQAEREATAAANEEAGTAANIEQVAEAHERTAEAAREQAETERDVAGAIEEAAASGERVEQTASAHERAAQAAGEQARATEEVANAESNAAAAADNAAAGAEGAANGLKNISGELSRIESYAKTGLSGLSDAKFDAGEVEAVVQRYQQLAATIAEIRTGQQTVDSGKLAELRAEANAIQETIAAIRRKASEQEAASKAARKASAEQKQASREEQQDAERAASIEKRTATLRSQVSNFIQNNTRAYSMYREQLDGMMNELSGGNVKPERLTQIATELKNIDTAAKQAGATGQTFFEKLQAGWAKFAGWSLISRSFMLVIRGFKQMITSIKDIDAAMTELRKVTDLTSVGYERFYDQAVKVATSIGATVSNTIDAAAD